MAAALHFEDLRLYLHSKGIDHAWLRTVLEQYLSQNKQTDMDTFTDHSVWEYRNTIADFGNLLQDEPDELDDDELED